MEELLKNLNKLKNNDVATSVINGLMNAASESMTAYGKANPTSPSDYQGFPMPPEILRRFLPLANPNIPQAAPEASSSAAASSSTVSSEDSSAKPQSIKDFLQKDFGIDASQLTGQEVLDKIISFAVPSPASIPIPIPTPTSESDAIIDNEQMIRISLVEDFEAEYNKEVEYSTKLTQEICDMEVELDSFYKNDFPSCIKAKEQAEGKLKNCKNKLAQSLERQNYYKKYMSAAESKESKDTKETQDSKDNEAMFKAFQMLAKNALKNAIQPARPAPSKFAAEERALQDIIGSTMSSSSSAIPDMLTSLFSSLAPSKSCSSISVGKAPFTECQKKINAIVEEEASRLIKRLNVSQSTLILNWPLDGVDEKFEAPLLAEIQKKGYHCQVTSDQPVPVHVTATVCIPVVCDLPRCVPKVANECDSSEDDSSEDILNACLDEVDSCLDCECEDSQPEIKIIPITIPSSNESVEESAKKQRFYDELEGEFKFESGKEKDIKKIDCLKKQLKSLEDLNRIEELISEKDSVSATAAMLDYIVNFWDDKCSMFQESMIGRIDDILNFLVNLNSFSYLFLPVYFTEDNAIYQKIIKSSPDKRSIIMMKNLIDLIGKKEAHDLLISFINRKSDDLFKTMSYFSLISAYMHKMDKPVCNFGGMTKCNMYKREYQSQPKHQSTSQIGCQPMFRPVNHDQVLPRAQIINPQRKLIISMMPL